MALENLIKQEKLEAKDVYQSALMAKNARRDEEAELTHLKENYVTLQIINQEL